MKRIATIAVILVQFWLLSPVCCCWFKAAAKPTGGDCCCSRTDKAPPAQVPDEKSSDCRCNESKFELPPQMVPADELSSKRLKLDQLLPISTPVSLIALAMVQGPEDFRQWPPPPAVADRLASLQRFNL